MAGDRGATVGRHDPLVANPDDDRTGRLLVTIRRRSKVSQRELARAAGVPRENVMLIEAGDVGQVPLDRTRRIFAAAGGRAQLATWWNGAAADRILDERHAALVELAVGVFQRRGWTAAVEVSFSEYGERGSIDILAALNRELAVAVCEVKSDLGSLEETNRRLDVKRRLSPIIAERQFGWRPGVVGRILIVPESAAIRRIVAAHTLTMASAYPVQGREVRAWLRQPSQSISGLWFLSEVAVGDQDPRPRR